jgi:vacuolar-type H+-ATPase subunit F/Vma7
MKRIAVIGRTDSIDYFRVIGCETFHAEGGRLEEERLIEILSGGFKVVFVTEEIFSRNRELFRRNVKGMLPVVCIIPDLADSQWKDGAPSPLGVAIEEQRRAIVHAVGQDISNVEE